MKWRSMQQTEPNALQNLIRQFLSPLNFPRFRFLGIYFATLGNFERGHFRSRFWEGA
jgi:hypothetical protein